MNLGSSLQSSSGLARAGLLWFLALALTSESQRWVEDHAVAESERTDSPPKPRPNYHAAARLLRLAGATH